jgi:hypothetical protein
MEMFLIKVESRDKNWECNHDKNRPITLNKMEMFPIKVESRDNECRNKAIGTHHNSHYMMCCIYCEVSKFFFFYEKDMIRIENATMNE